MKEHDPTEQESSPKRVSRSAGNSSEDSTADFLRQYSRGQLRILAFIQVFIPNLNDAEEILQETSAILWSKWSEFDQSRDFVKWACGIARLEVFSFLRKRKRRLYLDESILEEIGADPESILRSRDQDHAIQEALSSCLEELPAEKRSLLTDRYRHGIPVADLAQVENVSARLIYKRLDLIRDMLKRCIERKTQGAFLQ